MSRVRAHARELGVAVAKLVVVSLTVAAMVFGLVVALYDHSGPPADPAVSASSR